MIIKCKDCGDILIGDNKGTFISCSCGQHYIDQTPYYVRVGGVNYEEVDKDIILTCLSQMGHTCHVDKHLSKMLKKNNIDRNVILFDEYKYSK